MKWPPCVLSLVLFVCSSALAEEFTTSRGLRSLPPVAGLSSEAALKQAGRSAEAALGELMADATALDKAGAPLVKQAAALEQSQKDEQASLKKLETDFNDSNKKYSDSLAMYEEHKAVHEADRLNLRNEVAALRSVPSPQQDPATAARLTRWANEFDARQASLDQEGQALLAEHDSVETQRLALAKSTADAGTKLRSVHDSLVASIAAYQVSQGLLQTQLRQCTVYLTQVRETLRSKYGQAPEHSSMLEGALQRLRAIDGRVPTKS